MFTLPISTTVIYLKGVSPVRQMLYADVTQQSMAGQLKRRLKEAVKVIGSGGFLFVSYLTAVGDERFYANQLMPLLQRVVGAETAHRMVVRLIGLGLVPRNRYQDPASLEVNVLGRRFRNPLGLAARFDRHDEAIDGLYQLGFGFVEVGTSHPTPQRAPGFRLTSDQAVINRCDGYSLAAVEEKLKAREMSQLELTLAGQPMGINLGMSESSQDGTIDLMEGVRTLGALADYLVVNVSSLGDMHVKGNLHHLLVRVLKERDTLPREQRLPILVKMTSDLVDQDKQDIAEIVAELGVDGLVISSTAVSGSETVLDPQLGAVGQSCGRALKDRSTQAVREMYHLTEGKVPIIGAGGVASGQDALDKIRAGASLVQLYSAFTCQGPPVATRIKRELQQLLKEQGFTCIAEAVGADFRPLDGKLALRRPARDNIHQDFELTNEAVISVI